MKLNLQWYYSLLLPWCVNITWLFFKGLRGNSQYAKAVLQWEPCRLHAHGLMGEALRAKPPAWCATCPQNSSASCRASLQQKHNLPKRPICLVGLKSLFKEVCIQWRVAAFNNLLLLGLCHNCRDFQSNVQEKIQPSRYKN